MLSGLLLLSATPSASTWESAAGGVAGFAAGAANPTLGSGSSSNQLPNYQMYSAGPIDQTPGYQQGVAYDNRYAQNTGIGSVQKTDTTDVNPRTGLGWKKGPR